MTKLIEANHLPKPQTFNPKTKEWTDSDGKMYMLPAAPGTCPECAVKHSEDQPHNAQSLFYQMKFFNDHGRQPSWKDAMAHCNFTVTDFWRSALIGQGVDVDAGDILPKKKRKK